jgi:hypothetical protein
MFTHFAQQPASCRSPQPNQSILSSPLLSHITFCNTFLLFLPGFLNCSLLPVSRSKVLYDFSSPSYMTRATCRTLRPLISLERLLQLYVKFYLKTPLNTKKIITMFKTAGWCPQNDVCTAILSTV